MYMQTDNINWGIIGCGDVCEVKSGPAFSKVPHSKLVAVMRRDAVKAKDFAERHRVPKFYTDATDLVNDSEVNAVYIATPPSLHEVYTELALKAGKPVYVEKPVTTDASSVIRMIGYEKKYAGKVSVAHYRRALPLFRTVKQLLEENRIGKVKMVLLKTLQPLQSKIVAKTSDNWRIDPAYSGGGLFHDLSPHQLDILYWIFGKPEMLDVFATNQGKHYNVPDVTMVRLSFANDVYFNGVWNFNIADSAVEDSCEIIGDKGSMRFSFFSMGHLTVTSAAGTELIEMQYPTHIQQPHINNVVQFFRNEGPNPCSLEEALVTMEIMDRAR
jgi:1,5-anhydro-D-fructose reductase (1,5-anhydro-D-mannitol-forming)